MESNEYMRKFVLEYLDWVTAKDIVARAQNCLTTESLLQDSKDKKFLITITAEEV